MPPIRKVVIPVAGFGTRFLPVTKAQPKEMLPVVDKPVIQYIVEEAVRAGITDVILVTGSTKRPIEDHFDRNETLESFLEANGKHDAAEKIRQIAEMANFIYIRQKGPYGNGTPILNAQQVIGDEPFAVVWGDDIWSCQQTAHLKQLMDVYEKYSDPVLSAQPTDDEGTERYGIIEGVEVEPGIYQANTIIEKPGPKKTKSRLAMFSGQILTPDIFPILQKTPLGKNNELWLVDAIAELAKHRSIYAKIIEGDYFDVGNKLGWLKANVEYGLRDPDVAKAFKDYLKKQI